MMYALAFAAVVVVLIWAQADWEWQEYNLREWRKKD